MVFEGMLRTVGAMVVYVCNISKSAQSYANFSKKWSFLPIFAARNIPLCPIRRGAEPPAGLIAEVAVCFEQSYGAVIVFVVDKEGDVP